MDKNLPPFQPPVPRKSLVLPPSVSISYQLQTAAIEQNGSSRTNCDRRFTITGEIRSPNEPYRLETLVKDEMTRRMEGPVVLWSVLEVSATNSVCVITRRESGNEHTQQALQIPLKDGPFNYSHVSFTKLRSETDGRVHPVDFFVRFRVLCWLFNNRMVSCELGREGPFRVYYDTECQPSIMALDLTSQDQINTELLPARPGVSQNLNSLSAPSFNKLTSEPVSHKGYSHEDPFQHSSGFIDPSQLFRREPTSDVVGVPKMTAGEGIQHHSQRPSRDCGGLIRRNGVRGRRFHGQDCHLCPISSCRRSFRDLDHLKRYASSE